MMRMSAANSFGCLLGKTVLLLTFNKQDAVSQFNFETKNFTRSALILLLAQFRLVAAFVEWFIDCAAQQETLC